MIDFDRLEYIKNVNDDDDKKWAYKDFLVGSYFQLSFRDGVGVRNHALNLPKGALIILSQKRSTDVRRLTHIVELVNEGIEDEAQWKQSDPWGIFRWVKVHWVADFDNSDADCIPSDKKFMKADWGWFDTKAKSLASPKLLAQWKSIENLRMHLKEVFTNTYPSRG
ncbi:hypothetical protein ACN4EK_15625 [Pantanalinema rosaneae CENA516]|uniref:hypothetical protein n=1 Tax=Pantanalinema rosaneae TaxID=1620701 RepID=UPI003D6E695D